MPRLLVAGKMHPSGEALLDRLDADVTYVPNISEEFLDHLPDADALVIRTQPLAADAIARAQALRVVSRHGVGYDAVDLDALNARGIALMIVGDVNSVSVAEHAMGLLLAAAKRTIRADRAVRDPGLWGWRNALEPRDLAGKRLLIVGFGRIGRHLARMAAAFGMEVRAHDPFLERAGWPEGDAAPMDLADGLAWADAVSLHVPAGDRPLLGAAEIAAMKPGAILVNTARGGVADEAALTEALRSGHLAAAGLDVFEAEPPDPDNPLFALDQAVLSPHVAGLSNECADRMAIACIENAMAYLAGNADPDLIVNRQALDG